MYGKALLKKLSESSGVSGYEEGLFETVSEYFKPLSDEIRQDALGNIVVFKKGRTSNGKIMLAAHLDEIGLMVKKIDKNGYLHVTGIGGFDQRVLPCQEVVVHGRENHFGIIGILPPHITGGDHKNSIKLEDLRIDIGYDYDNASEKVSVGDIVTIRRDLVELSNGRLAGKALDDRAGVVSLYEALSDLKDVQHDIDCYIVLTVQEEVGTRGAITSTYGIEPDLGIAVDVGFGKTPELNTHDTIELSKGPAISVGGNTHPNIFKGLKDLAKEYSIPYQIEVAPGATGTDAWAMQISRGGVATGLLSIPLRYMHTSVETIDYQDVKHTGRLLSKLVTHFNSEDLEGFLCY